MSKKKIKVINYGKLIDLQDSCSTAANRLALISSMIINFPKNTTPIGLTKDDFEAEFSELIVEQIENISKYLFSISTNSKEVNK